MIPANEPSMNRHEKRCIASILRHRTTTVYERGQLEALGVRNVVKRDGRMIITDIRVDCFDTWAARTAKLLEAYGPRPRERVLHRAAGLERSARNALKRQRRARMAAC